MVVVIKLLGFDHGRFFGATVTSPDSANLVGWFDQPDGSDLHLMTGTVTLTEYGRTLTIAPDRVEFNIGGCAFVRYEGALKEVF